MVHLDEHVHDVGTAARGFSLGLGQKGLELRVAGLLTGIDTNHVGNRHLEQEADAALEVEAEANLHFLTFGQGLPAQKNGFLAHVVKILACGILALLGFNAGGLLVILARHEGERVVEEADKGQEHGNELDESFVLHLCF